MAFLNKKESSLIPAFVVASVGIQIILLLITCVQLGKMNIIASTKTPTLVELVDGTSARVKPTAYNERTPQSISVFVGRTMTGLLSWNTVLKTLPDGEDPANKQQVDPGVQLGERKVTTATWQAGFGLSEDFRQPFLKEISNLTPQDVFNGKTQSLLIVRHLSEPQQLRAGRWKQDLVANLVLFENGNQVGKGIAFDKTIFIRAVDTPLPPLNATETQLAAYRARKDGFEIFKIQDLELIPK